MPMRRTVHPLSATCSVLALVIFIGVFASPAKAQKDPDRRLAVDETRSRAEQEADRLVSLSADRIVSMLQSEPGLLLQVKKLLVRKAYDQGRLLDPDDLSDDALFRLIRQDQNIRALITREMENRSYIRAKPTREELEAMSRDPRREMMGAKTTSPSSPDQPSLKMNQEDVFWSRHEMVVPESSPKSTDPYPLLGPDNRQSQPAGDDARRQVQRAQMPPRSRDDADSLDGQNGDFRDEDTPMIPRVRPDELPTLLASNSADRSFDSPGISRAGLSTSIRPSTAFPNPLDGTLATGSLPDQPSQSAMSPPQNANAAGRSWPIAPPFPSRGPNPQTVARHRADPYADVPALYDLYSQYSKRSAALERFGTQVFRNGTGNLNELPMDMPVGPDYILGPGDSLSINIWGGVSQRLQRVVDREGRVALPEVGAIEVNGRSLGEVQHVVQSALRSQFRDVQADISLSRLRTVRVYVVGDVERPGAYDVSSLSTPLSAVFTAGGPTSRGSLRILRHFRARQLVQQVDVYDLLLHGVSSGLSRLQPGDTVLVPPLGPEITIEGMVRRPAIYELNGEKSLAEALELAGGVLPTGTLRQIDVDRLQAHESRTMLRVDLPENNDAQSANDSLDTFLVQDGDKIKISPILPYSQKTVFLDGHVFRPGKYAYKDGMTLTDLVHSYQDLMPEPYRQHAEIIRLNPPAFEPEILAFNLDDVFTGKQPQLQLKPFDTVRIFGRFDFEDQPVITVTGEVRDPGDHVTNGATNLRDAVYLAGGASPEAELDDVQVFRETDGGKLRVLSVNLRKALDGDNDANIALQPKDRVFIHRSIAKLDPPQVNIQGEVARPGKYPLGAEMTAAQLVRLAGGFKRGAFTQEADLTRYVADRGSRIESEQLSVPIGQALAGEPDTDVRLRDGDVLTIRQLSGWADVGATITVKGEVIHPGTYGIQEGETLSSIIARAGGFRADAYPYAAVFERVQVRDIEEKNRVQLISELQGEGAELKLTSTTEPEDPAARQASLLQWKTTIESLQRTPPAGRLVIHISNNLHTWANTPADIQVRAGDSIYIPKKPNFVMVDGAVYHGTAVTYRPNKSAGWYLKQAGGPSNMANKKAIFVIRADGSVIGGGKGMFTGGVMDAALQPGDMVIVPEKAFGGTSRWKNSLQVAQVVSAIGIAVQVARGF